MQNITFNQLKKISKDQEGLVLVGCGGDPQEWIDGVTKILKDENLIHEDFKDVYKTTSTGGRVDLTFILHEEQNIEIGKLAMWRLRFGDISWLSDFVVNYEDHYRVGA